MPSATQEQQSDGGTQYALLVQKQAGTHGTLSVTVTPPSQSTIASLAPTPDPTPTPGAVAGAVSKGNTQFSGQLTKNIELLIDY